MGNSVPVQQVAECVWSTSCGGLSKGPCVDFDKTAEADLPLAGRGGTMSRRFSGAHQHRSTSLLSCFSTASYKAHTTMANPPEDPPATCPIDPAARAAWLEKAKQARQPSPAAPSPPPPIPIPQQARLMKTRPLASDREISTIPRADPTLATTTPNPSSAKPANHERETGADAKSGNWIYPSERMFFEAMKRKNYAPVATDMAAIVPIHNAVNEKAWAEIKAWERRFAWSRTENQRCGGPRLHSFSGDSKNLSPRARWNSLLGYQTPFDRHDWVVERCPGEGRVEYVIDFYAGKDDGKGKGLSFYLDVRPKLNSWEGWKMRMARAVGL